MAPPLADDRTYKANGLGCLESVWIFTHRKASKLTGAGHNGPIRSCKVSLERARKPRPQLVSVVLLEQSIGNYNAADPDQADRINTVSPVFAVSKAQTHRKNSLARGEDPTRLARIQTIVRVIHVFVYRIGHTRDI